MAVQVTLAVEISVRGTNAYAVFLYEIMIKGWQKNEGATAWPLGAKFFSKKSQHEQLALVL